MDPLTLEQAVAVSGYTGFLCCNFGDLHGEVEKRLGRPVWTHEFADPAMRSALQSMFKPDFIALCHEKTPTTDHQPQE